MLVLSTSAVPDNHAGMILILQFRAYNIQSILVTGVVGCYTVLQLRGALLCADHDEQRVGLQVHAVLLVRRRRRGHEQARAYGQHIPSLLLPGKLCSGHGVPWDSVRHLPLGDSLRRSHNVRHHVCELELCRVYRGNYGQSTGALNVQNCILQAGLIGVLQ